MEPILFWPTTPGPGTQATCYTVTEYKQARYFSQPVLLLLLLAGCILWLHRKNQLFYYLTQKIIF